MTESSLFVISFLKFSFRWFIILFTASDELSDLSNERIDEVINESYLELDEYINENYRLWVEFYFLKIGEKNE